jgi:hypothetical protein
MSIPTAAASAEPMEMNFVMTVKFKLDEKDTLSLIPDCIVMTPLKNPDVGYIFIPTPHLQRCPSKEELIPGRPIQLPVDKIYWAIQEILEPWMDVGCVDPAVYFYFNDMMHYNRMKYIGGQQIINEIMLASGGHDPVNFGKRLARQIVNEKLARHEPNWWEDF